MMLKQESKHKYLLNKRLLFKTLQGLNDYKLEVKEGHHEGGSNED
jgi:hypothetical protein